MRPTKRCSPRHAVMTTTRFLVTAMDCATEKEMIANHLEQLAEVERVDFDLLDRVVTVHHRAEADATVEAALRDIGMAPKRLVDDDDGVHALPRRRDGLRYRAASDRESPREARGRRRR